MLLHSEHHHRHPSPLPADDPVKEQIAQDKFGKSKQCSLPTGITFRAPAGALPMHLLTLLPTDNPVCLLLLLLWLAAAGYDELDGERC